MRSVLKRYQFWICIIALIVLIFFIRLPNNLHRMKWVDDSARDVLVAELISMEGRYIDIHPLSGGFTQLYNSSIYYNFLALIRTLASNRESFLLFYGFISSTIMVIGGFLTGYAIKGLKLGVSFALILLVHPYLGIFNITVYQRYFAMSMTPLFIFLCIYTLKSKSSVLLYLTSFFYILLVFTHYSYLTFSPVLLWVIYKVFHQQKKAVSKTIIFFITTCTISVIGFLSTKTNLTQVLLTIKNRFVPTCYICSNKIASLINIISWSKEYIYLWYVILGIGLVVLITKKKSDFDIVFLLVIFSYFVAQFFFGVIGKPFLQEYFYYVNYIPIFLLFPILSLESILKSNKYIFLYTVIFAMIILPFGIATYSNIKTSYGEYDHVKHLASLLIADNTSSGMSKKPLVIDYTPWADPGWFSPAFDYFLYEDSKQYAKLSNKDNNLEKFAKISVPLYLVCKYWEVDNQNTNAIKVLNSICLDSFIKKYGNVYNLSSNKLYTNIIYTQPSDVTDFTIYKLHF